MVSQHGTSTVVVVCLLGIGGLLAFCRSGGGETPPHRKRPNRVAYFRQHLEQPTPVTDGFLQIALQLPEKVDFGGTSTFGPIHAKVQITNVWHERLALFCDSSPRAVLYLRFESLLQYNTPWILERELLYDLGDQLLDGADDLAICVLQPGEVVETEVNIAPVLYPPDQNWGTFRVRVELRAPPADSLTPWPTMDAPSEVWMDNSIVSEESIITVTGVGND